MSGWEPQPQGRSPTPLATGWEDWEPWDAPVGEPELPPKQMHRGRCWRKIRPLFGLAMAADLTMVNSDVLDCGVCFLPLKPPIFQCDVGHAICSPCHDEVKVAGSKCYACGGVAVASGYRRCHAMDLVVESVRVPCPNAPYGCVAMPAYHELKDHVAACQLVPCHCPGESCGFAGPMVALVDHIASVHGWPCKHVSAHSCPSINVDLRAGFNFIIVTDDDEDDKQYTDDDEDDKQYLVLLNVTRHPFCRTVSVIWIRPESAAAKEIKMRIELSYSSFLWRSRHEQTTEFVVDCSDLSHGLPVDFNGYNQLMVPDAWFHEADGDAMKVKVGVALDEMSDHSYYDMDDDDRF